MSKLPPNNRWSQNNRSNIFGSLWASWNLDIRSLLGTTRVSPRTIINTDNITDLGVPVAFRTFTDQNGGVQYYWAHGGPYIFRAATTNGYITAFAKDSSTGTPSNEGSSDTGDMEIFGNLYLFVSTQLDLYRYQASNGQWTDLTGNNLTSGTPHLLCRFGDRIYVTDDDLEVKSIDAAAFSSLTTSSSYFLNLANKGFPVTTITFLRPDSTGIWVGTLNQSENECRVFKWDGQSADDPNQEFIIPDCAGALAGVVWNEVPWIMDNTGRLLYLNGSSFIEAPNGRLPVKDGKTLKNHLSGVNDRWIHPNGIDVIDGRINILINNEYSDNGATITEELPSGVWEYDPQTGWVHKMSLSNYTSSVKDYGQNRVSRVGALYGAKTSKTTSTTNGTMLLGAQIFSDSSTTKEVILYDDRNDTIQKYGYLVTQRIYSGELKDTWSKVYARIKKLLNATDSIAVKYRTEEVAPVEATITWVDTDTFTTTTDVSAYNPTTLGYSPEVEILQGDGAGKCAHISSMSEAGGTYTVNLDDTFAGVTTNTAKARFQFWKKAGPTFSDQTNKVAEFPVNATDTWIQFKVCMQFTGKNELDDIITAEKTNQEVE